MKKVHIKLMCVFVLVLLLISFVACGDKKVSEDNISTDSDAEVIQTEQEIREGINNLGTDEESLKLKVEYYDKLWQMDAFYKEDFEELCMVYEGLGDMKMMRETLIRKHTYYPEESNLGAISDIVIKSDTTDEKITSIINELNIYIVDYSVDNIRVLIETTSWQENMQDTLVGVKRKTMYVGEGYVAQISSDKYSTEIFFLRDDNSLDYYKNSQAGVVWGTTTYTDGSYNGDYVLRYYDYDGNFIKECRGTFSNNVSVGDFELDFDGNTYIGEFDQNGKTTVSQSEDIIEIGGVIYAYDSTGEKYVYIENTTVESFFIDNIYLGLETYEPW